MFLDPNKFPNQYLDPHLMYQSLPTYNVINIIQYRGFRKYRIIWG